MPSPFSLFFKAKKKLSTGLIFSQSLSKQANICKVWRIVYCYCYYDSWNDEMGGIKCVQAEKLSIWNSFFTALYFVLKLCNLSVDKYLYYNERVFDNFFFLKNWGKTCKGSWKRRLKTNFAYVRKRNCTNCDSGGLAKEKGKKFIKMMVLTHHYHQH